MTPRWPAPIFLDASIQKKVRHALELVRRDVLHPDMPTCPVNVGDADETWLPTVGKNDWLAVWRDQRIETRPRERQALIDNGVRAFVLTGAGNLSKWALLELLVRRWSRIEQIGANGEPGPYLYSVTSNRIKRVI